MLTELALRGERAPATFLREYFGWGEHWYHLPRRPRDPAVNDLCADWHLVLCERVSDDDDLASALDALFGRYGLEGDGEAPPLLRAWCKANPRIASAAKGFAHVAERRLRSIERSKTGPELPFDEALLSTAKAFAAGERQLVERARLEHVALLRSAFHPPWIGRSRVVVGALARIDTEEARAALLDLAPRMWECRPPLRWALSRAITGLPTALALPLARRWIRRTTWALRSSAHEILEKHAEERDIPDIVRSLNECLDDDGHTYVDEAVTALRRFPGIGWLPGVERAFVELQCASCRREVARTLAVLDRDRFARTYARECLWDCNEATIQLGIEHAPFDEPLVRERLEELARGLKWLEGTTADAARTRLGSVS